MRRPVRALVGFDTGSAQRLGESGYLRGDHITDAHSVTRSRPVRGDEQVDGRDTGRVDGSFPAVAEHLPVAAFLDGGDQIGLS
jgi:hypothetical protein